MYDIQITILQKKQVGLNIKIAFNEIVQKWVMVIFSGQ